METTLPMYFEQQFSGEIYIPKNFQIVRTTNDRKDVFDSLQSLLDDTGKSLSEALLFGEHGENMLCTEIVLNVKNNFCTQQSCSPHVLSLEFSCIELVIQ